jgi:hypothetical protein
VTVPKDNAIYCIDRVFIAPFQYLGMVVTNENYSVSKGCGNGVICTVVGIVDLVTVQCCKNSPDFRKLDLFLVKEIGHYLLGQIELSGVTGRAVISLRYETCYLALRAEQIVQDAKESICT